MWKQYSIAKKYIFAGYDILSVIVILLSFDKIYRLRSVKGIKAWQVARLIERIPKAVKTFKRF